MKKIIAILAFGTLVTSCGENAESSNDLNSLKALKSEIMEQQNILAQQLSEVEAAIKAIEGFDNLPLVSTKELAVESFDHYVQLQGNITTKENVLIYPELSGTLLKVYVKKGDRVQKGTILAEIDNGGLSHQLEQLRAAAALAKTTFERQAKLWEQNIGSEIQYLQTKAQYESQQNAVAQLEKTLAKAIVKAPFSGIVDQLLQDPGVVVAPGPNAALFRIINLEHMYVTVDAPERYLGSVKKGGKAIVEIPVLSKRIETKVRQTGNYIAASNRSFEVEIGIPNDDQSIKPNLNAKVHINDYSNNNAILVPLSVISENAEGEQYVYTISTTEHEGVDIAHRRIITTGASDGERIEVLSGLEAGDQIVIEGARKLKDGQHIKVLN
jgi:RND family efflux transporter MFP subunit